MYQDKRAEAASPNIASDYDAFRVLSISAFDISKYAD
jgi:hypothetical protein